MAITYDKASLKSGKFALKEWREWTIIHHWVSFPTQSNKFWDTGAPRDGSGPRGIHQGPVGRIRGLRETNQDPAVAGRIRARRTDSGSMDEPGPRETNQGPAGRK